MTGSAFKRLVHIVEQMSDVDLAAKLLKLTPAADKPRHRDHVNYHLIKDEYDKRKWIKALKGEYVPKSDRQKNLEEQTANTRWLLYLHDQATRNTAMLPTKEFVELNGLGYLRLATTDDLRKMPEESQDQYVHECARTNRSRIMYDIERLRRELCFVISKERREREAQKLSPRTRRSKTPAYKRRSRRRFAPEEIEYFVPLWTKGVQEILDNHPRMKVEEAFKKYASTTKKLFGESFSWATIRNRIYEPGFAFKRKRHKELSESLYREKFSR